MKTKDIHQLYLFYLFNELQISKVNMCIIIIYIYPNMIVFDLNSKFCMYTQQLFPPDITNFEVLLYMNMIYVFMTFPVENL